MPDESAHALAHLGRSLVGEGHSEDGIRSNSKIVNKMRDAVGDHARLARTGAGKDQDRALDLLGGFPLLRIEFTEIQLSPVYRSDSSRENRDLRGFPSRWPHFGTRERMDAHQGNGNPLSRGSRNT